MDNDFKGELEVIQQMIKITKKRAMDSGNVLILWGVLFIVAMILAQILQNTISMDKFAIYFWVFPITGLVGTLILKKKKREKANLKTYADKIVSTIWAACGFSFVFIAIVFQVTSPQTVESMLIASIFFIIIGIGMLISGSAYQWNLLKLIGLLWWLGAILIQLIPESYLPIVFFGLLGFGLIVPGFIANQINKKENSKNE